MKENVKQITTVDSLRRDTKCKTNHNSGQSKERHKIYLVSLLDRRMCYVTTLSMPKMIYCWGWKDGSLVECHQQAKTAVLGEKPVPLELCPRQIPHWPAWHWAQASQWNDIDKGKLKQLEQDKPQCHTVYYRNHMNWPGIDPRPSRLDTSN
jgi:hypothetical protein